MPVPERVPEDRTDGDARTGSIGGLTERDRVAGADQIQQRGAFDLVGHPDLEARRQTCERVVFAGPVVVRMREAEILVGQVGEGYLGSRGEWVFACKQHENGFGGHGVVGDFRPHRQVVSRVLAGDREFQQVLGDLVDERCR